MQYFRAPRDEPTQLTILPARPTFDVRLWSPRTARNHGWICLSTTCCCIVSSLPLLLTLLTLFLCFTPAPFLNILLHLPLVLLCFYCCLCHVSFRDKLEPHGSCRNNLIWILELSAIVRTEKTSLPLYTPCFPGTAAARLGDDL